VALEDFGDFVKEYVDLAGAQDGGTALLERLFKVLFDDKTLFAIAPL
jgi:hypothetical protein